MSYDPNPVLRTLADAKGDLFAATAADAVARLPVGTNDQVLTADSAQATGLKWAAGGGGGGGTVPLWVSAHTLTPQGGASAKSDPWDDSSGNSGTVNGLDAKWTTAGASQSRVYENGKIIVTGTGAAGADTANASILYQTTPATPWDIRVRYNMRAAAGLQFYNAGGLIARASSSGKFWAPAAYCSSTSDITLAFHLALWRYASPTSRASAVSDVVLGVAAFSGFWVRIKYDGTNLVSAFSFDGEFYLGHVSEAKTVHFGADTIDGIGLFVDPFHTAAPKVGFGQFVVT